MRGVLIHAGNLFKRLTTASSPQADPLSFDGWGFQSENDNVYHLVF